MALGAAQLDAGDLALQELSAQILVLSRGVKMDFASAEMLSRCVRLGVSWTGDQPWGLDC